MYCPRLDHFVRFDVNGEIGKCGHMTNPPGFSSWEAMQASSWLGGVRSKMEEDIWPAECRRCQDTERASGHSVRLDSIKRHNVLSKVKSDYLILAGVLDNVCNSACQSCHAGLSTKIGSLYGKDYVRLDNQHLFDTVPWDRIVELDINGGEPTASPRYQKLLAALPPNTKLLRVNTNGSRVLPNIQEILDRGTQVIVTLSLDGVGPVHDYVRWPIQWNDYLSTVHSYRDLASRYRNLKLQAWTVIHALNIADFGNIQNTAQQLGLEHSWAFLERPQPLDVKFSNHLTRSAKHKLSGLGSILDRVACDRDNQPQLDQFIQQQDQLRNISIKDYL